MSAEDQEAIVTAYVLGELPDAERAAFEKRMSEDPALAALVAEYRETVGELFGAYRAEPAPQLAEEQQRRIVERAKRASPTRVTPVTKGASWFTWVSRAAVLGACLFVVVAPFCYILLCFTYGMASMSLSPSMPAPAALKMADMRQELEVRPEPEKPAGGPARPTNDPAPAMHPENPFRDPEAEPLSTFSIDVDTASYSICRQYLSHRSLPPPQVVRIEEFVNYFPYDYAPPSGGAAFASHVEVASCPWQPAHRLVKIGIKGKVVEKEARKPSNLVFLVDVSGSMATPDRLPLVQTALKNLVTELGEADHIAIVTYSGAFGTLLPSTSGDRKETILSALDGLVTGGGTNGAGGIQAAYEEAVQNFIPGGVNRVLMCTDGDFNVGVTSAAELETLITEKAKTGVFLTMLGVGRGASGDHRMETLADKGNGNYAFLDGEKEAHKVLVEQLSGTLVTIAKDMKIQVEFDPKQVARYRLIGYENRMLAAKDFDDDRKDAGELGAGHTVTALYEIVPAGGRAPTSDFMNLKLRFKEPAGDTSQLLEFPIRDSGHSFEQATGDFQFAAGVALYAMLLRGSPHGGGASLELVLELVKPGVARDPGGRRAELVQLVENTRELMMR